MSVLTIMSLLEKLSFSAEGQVSIKVTQEVEADDLIPPGLRALDDSDTSEGYGSQQILHTRSSPRSMSFGMDGKWFKNVVRALLLLIRIETIITKNEMTTPSHCVDEEAGQPSGILIHMDRKYDAKCCASTVSRRMRVKGKSQ